MRLASVTFSPKLENIGGAQIPAFAFKEWCEIFGHDCSVIGCSNETNGIDITNYNTIMHPNDINFLNGFDAIFFSTPIMYCNINMSEIKIPFMVMIHGESDIDIYGGAVIDSMLDHDMCIGVIHINPNSPNIRDKFYWHPCCSPSDLIDGKIIPKDNNGLLYASRIRRWLNYKLFMKTANENRDIIKESHMYGPCSRVETRMDVIQNHGCINIHIGPFKRKEPYSDNTGLFWDVAGYGDKRIRFKRISLSAYEALKNGYMPIITKGTAPEHFDGKFIEIPYEANHNIIRERIENYIKYKDGYWDMINDVAANSYTGKDAIEYQVGAILNKFQESI